MSVAASLPPAARKSLAIEVLSKTEPISHLATQHQVSRPFLYQQGQKAKEALDATFSAATDEAEVLFYLPITNTCLQSEWDCTLEIFQGNQPVLVGVDALSTYCYLLAAAEHTR